MNIDTSNNILASFQTYSLKESMNVESNKFRYEEINIRRERLQEKYKVL